MVLPLLDVVLSMYSPSRMAFEFQAQLLLFPGIFVKVHDALVGFPCFDPAVACAVALPLTFSRFFTSKWKRQQFPLLRHHLMEGPCCCPALSCLVPPARLNGSVHSRNEIEWVSSHAGLQKGGPFKDNFGFPSFFLQKSFSNNIDFKKCRGKGDVFPVL